MNSRLNTLLESWITVADGHDLTDDALPDVITPEQLHKLWERARYSVGAALVTLKNEPAPERSTGLQSVMKRWVMELVCLS
jgi:hypothetical protein